MSSAVRQIDVIKVTCEHNLPLWRLQLLRHTPHFSLNLAIFDSRHNSQTNKIFKKKRRKMSRCHSIPSVDRVKQTVAPSSLLDRSANHNLHGSLIFSSDVQAVCRDVTKDSCKRILRFNFEKRLKAEYLFYLRMFTFYSWA